MNADQENQLLPYFDLFVDQARQGQVSGFSPRSDDCSFEDYPPVFDLNRLLATPIAETQLYQTSDALKELFAFVPPHRPRDRARLPCVWPASGRAGST